MINELSKKLTSDYGKSFDKSNLSRMRKLYSLFNNFDALRQELSWTHYRLIIKLNNERLLSAQEENKNEVRNEIKKLKPERNINAMVMGPFGSNLKKKTILKRPNNSQLSI